MIEYELEEERAFVETIQADRSEFTARLVYADWLDEHDRPLDAARQRVLARPADDDMRRQFVKHCTTQQADLIRTQIELEKYPQSPPTKIQSVDFTIEPEDKNDPQQVIAAREVEMMMKRIAELKKRESILMQGFERELCSQLPQPEMLCGMRSLFGESWCARLVENSRWQRNNTLIVQRGFVGRVVCSLATWLKCADAINDSQPVKKVLVSGDYSTDLLEIYEKENKRYRFALRGGKVTAYRSLLSIESSQMSSSDVRYDVIKYLLDVEWPWIEFDVPDIIFSTSTRS